MATLSTRSVSLSDHVKRRKNSAASKRSSDLCGATTGSSGSSSKHAAGNGTIHNNNSSIIGSASMTTNSPLRVYSPQHPPPSGPIGILGRSSSEGGYDSHVASYGNYDAPSAYCRSYHASEHGCYAAESHIVGGVGVGSGSMGWRTNSATATTDNNTRAVMSDKSTTHMARLESYSNPLLDLEEQRYICSSSRQRRTVTQRSSSSLQQTPSSSSSGPNGQGSHDPRFQADSSSCCSSAPTASTVGSSGSSSNGSSYYSHHHSIDPTSSIPPLDEDAIRQGIIDFSTLVATYLAGALSFIIGIFLTLLSPLIKIIKCIVGDVLGLLGDAGFLHELGSLWRLYRDLRRSSDGSHYSSSSNGDYHQYANHHHHYRPRYQDDTSLEDGSTTVYSAETSSQFVGGWRPHVCPSVGSGCSSSVNTPNSMGRTRPSSSYSWTGTANVSASPRPHSLVPLGPGGRPGPGDFPAPKNNDEVSSCPPNLMMRHQPTAAQSSELSPYYSTRSNDAYVRRPTDLSHHQPLLPPRTQHNGSLYPQAPTHRYPRSKSDVTS